MNKKNKNWIPQLTPVQLAEGHTTEKSMLLQTLIGWNNHFKGEIDRAKKPGRKRNRTQWRSIDD